MEVIEGATIIPAECVVQIDRKLPIFRRAVSELVAVEMINPGWNENVLIDVERRGNQLRVNVHEVVIRVRAVIPHGTECPLPFLRLKATVRKRRMVDKPFKIQFANTRNLWPRRKIQIQKTLI